MDIRDMMTRDISTIFAELVEHPLRDLPYSRIRFVRIDGNGTLLYAVEQPDGALGPAQNARNILESAACVWGAECFYHGTDCPDNPDGRLVAKRQRDHVLASSRAGKDHLHNLVLCCEHANSRKSARSICEFDIGRAQRYLEAWSRHVSGALSPRPI